MRVAIAGGDVAGAQLLHERQDEAADGGAGDAAEAAEDDDGEGLERGEIAHGRVDDEHRAEQRAGRRRKAGAEREGRGVDAVDLDAHQRGGLAVLEGGAHRLAEPGAVDERVGCRRSAPARPRTRTAGSTTPTPDRAPAARTGNGVSIDLATPDQVSCSTFCMRDPGADHHQHGGVDVGAAQPAQQHELDGRARARRPAAPRAPARERSSRPAPSPT